MRTNNQPLGICVGQPCLRNDTEHASFTTISSYGINYENKAAVFQCSLLKIQRDLLFIAMARKVNSRDNLLDWLPFLLTNALASGSLLDMLIWVTDRYGNWSIETKEPDIFFLASYSCCLHTQMIDLIQDWIMKKISRW